MVNALVSGGIFAVSLGLIFSEKINRTIVTMAGASLMILLGSLLGFYTEENALQSIDWDTLGLLLGMMILVAMLEPTGFFQYMAVRASKLSGGEPVRLFLLLGSVTTVLSMFLDNVTTVVLIAPVTVLICEVMGLPPAPFLMAEALLSNTGGVATLVGDPPNVLIGSAANLTFLDFILHATPVVLFAWAGAVILLRILFRAELRARPINAETIQALNPAEAITDRRAAVRILIVIGVAILLFFLHGLLHVSPALVALSSAAAALVLVRPPVDDILRRVEWSVLLFFGALFVMVGGLERAGVLNLLVSVLEGGAGLPAPVFGVLLIWVVALISAVVDNVPITIALIPVIQGLGQAGMNPNPLWWALAFGAGFGGNGTIIGSSANIVVAALSEKNRSPITSALWNRRGLPVMLLTCLIASLIYYLAYPWFAD